MYNEVGGKMEEATKSMLTIMDKHENCSSSKQSRLRTAYSSVRKGVWIE